MSFFFTKVGGRLPTLHTPRLRLRMIRMKDAENMYSYSRDPEVARYVLWYAHTSIADTKGYIRYMIAQYKQNKPASWAIARREDDRIIGTIGFGWIDDENGSAEVGYSLARREWNRGYMTEALREVLRYGFEELHLHRIEAQHELENSASGIVMEKCGMQKEGLLRERLYNKGQYVDVYLYSILLGEWREIKL